ncbi:hypothetical protein QYF36_023035 [Acer negundo]|nr:hypothetical protein QYF36_023035 [Acer negundo]
MPKTPINYGLNWDWLLWNSVHGSLITSRILWLKREQLVAMKCGVCFGWDFWWWLYAFVLLPLGLVLYNFGDRVAVRNPCRSAKDVPDGGLIQVKPSIDSEVWRFDDESWKVDNCYISPWNVLRCYLEITLQVGQVYELVGNGDEAEFYLLCGKNISYSQSLPIFKVVFSSLLGKIFHKKRLWKQTEDEFLTAKRLLENSTEFSCTKCSLMLVAIVEQHLGDLATSDFLKKTETHYYKELCRLNSTVWKNLISCPEKAECDSIVNGNTTRATKCGVCNTMELKRVKPNAAMEGKTCMQQDEGLAQSCNICNNMKSWQCLPTEVIECGSVDGLINMKWELLRRKLSLTILDGLGKCKGYLKQIDKEQGFIFESVSVLINRNMFSHTYAYISSISFLDLIGKEFPGDVFAFERAVILYNICWLKLKGYNLKESSLTWLLFSQNSHATGASDIGNLLRIAHKSVNDLDRVVQDFFKGLPSTNIICISFLEGSYSKLLKDLLSEPSYGNAWMLISRLNSMSQPIVILRPVNEVLEGTLLYNIHG